MYAVRPTAPLCDAYSQSVAGADPASSPLTCWVASRLRAACYSCCSRCESDQVLAWGLTIGDVFDPMLETGHRQVSATGLLCMHACPKEAMRYIELCCVVARMRQCVCCELVSARKDTVMSVASGAGNGQVEGGTHAHMVSHDSRLLYVPIGQICSDCEMAVE